MWSSLTHKNNLFSADFASSIGTGFLRLIVELALGLSMRWICCFKWTLTVAVDRVLRLAYFSMHCFLFYGYTIR